MKNRINQEFNKLTIIEQLPKSRCIAKCKCGNIKEYRTSKLVNKTTKSCGCSKIERLKLTPINIKHNKSNTKLYKVFSGMKNRCYNKNRDDYPNYGGRGIIVCKEWLDDFIIFYNWALNDWKEGLTIERKDVNGNYCPENCCWIPANEQSKNQTKNHKITAFGETKNLIDWERDTRCSVKGITIIRRIKYGLMPEEAITTPYRKVKNKCD